MDWILYLILALINSAGTLSFVILLVNAIKIEDKPQQIMNSLLVVTYAMNTVLGFK